MMIHYTLNRAFLAIAALITVALPNIVLAADPPEWTAPVKPFRIAGNVYYVGTKGLAAYLIGDEQDALLLDGTLAENAKLIEKNIQQLGFPLRSVKMLISDHAHYDHVAALAQIKRDTGAKFLASAGDRWALEHGTPRGDTNYGVLRFPPIKVDTVVRDGETIRVGSVSMTAHLTPGHTPGCTSWSTTISDGGSRREVLFLCSITVAGNILVGNRAYPAIAEDFRATFAKLATMQTDILLTSHPEMADVLGREARREAGDVNAFFDPTALSALVDQSKANFDNALAKARSDK